MSRLFFVKANPNSRVPQWAQAISSAYASSDQSASSNISTLLRSLGIRTSVLFVDKNNLECARVLVFVEGGGWL